MYPKDGTDRGYQCIKIDSMWEPNSYSYVYNYGVSDSSPHYTEISYGIRDGMITDIALKAV